MPARSKSQQRLFGMVHAYQKGKLKNAPEEVKNIARSISDEDAEHFAKTKHKGLPEKKAYERGFMDKMVECGMPIEKRANWMSKIITRLGKLRGNPLSEREIQILLRKARLSPGLKATYRANKRVFEDPMGMYNEGRNLANIIGKTDKSDFRFEHIRDFAKKNGTEYLFKGQATPNYLDRLSAPRGYDPSSGLQWWTSNPYVAAGYAYNPVESAWSKGAITMIPARGQLRRFVHSHSTPHTSLSNPADIAKANKQAKHGIIDPSWRDADTAASRAADYETVLTPAEWRKFKGNSRTVFSNFDLTRFNEGDFPVMHGLNGMVDVGPKDGFIVPSLKAQKLLYRYPISNDQVYLLRAKRFPRLREIPAYGE